MKHKSNFIFLITFLAYSSIYIARVNLSMASPGLMKTGVLDSVQIGMLGSVFATVFAIGRLVNGALSDTAAPHIMLTTGLAACGVSNILIGFFPPYIGIFLLWTVNAYAQSMLWSSIIRVMTSVYDKNTAKRKISVMATSIAAGNVLGILVNTYLISHHGVKYAFFVPGVITLTLALCTFIFINGIAKQPAGGASHFSVFSLFKNREFLMINIPAIFHGVMKENISFWMVIFVVDTFAVDLSTSSYYILLIPTIGFIGRAMYPFLFRICKENEYRTALIGFAVCIAASVILCTGKTGMFASVAAFGIIYTAVSVINTAVVSVYPLRYERTGNSASVSGILDFATYLGAGISSAAYGFLIKSCGYMPMFLSWVVISVISELVLIKAERNAKAVSVV